MLVRLAACGGAWESGLRVSCVLLAGEVAHAHPGCWEMRARTCGGTPTTALSPDGPMQRALSADIVTKKGPRLEEEPESLPRT